ncbi:MAG: transglycosylase SLT domain-containing protein [Saprospiraceae bacterium]|nr:transglycosylase SLT domain-containing protein [Saprospiraceae bacterium]
MKHQLLWAMILAHSTVCLSLKANTLSWGTHLERITQQAQELDLPFEGKLDTKVEKRLKSYFTTGRLQAERMLGQMYLYFPLFEQELKNRGLPDELKYLPVVESRLIPDVYSSANAAGLWQFIEPTARHYELEVHEVVDERLDPVRATRSALQLLSELHQQFGDWTLALAAYNCGPGRVQRAIRKSKSRSYEKLKRFLPRQTRTYISRFTAAVYFGHYYQGHGLQARCPEWEFEDIDIQLMQEAVSFEEINKLTGLPIHKIKKLNPAFLTQYIPARKKGYYLMLPKEVMKKLKTYFHQKQDIERRSTSLAIAGKLLTAQHTSEALLAMVDLAENGQNNRAMKWRFEVADLRFRNSRQRLWFRP